MVRTLATTASLALVLPSTLSFGGWVQQQQRPLGVVAPKQRLPPLRGLILPGDEGYDVLMPGAKGSEAEEDDEQDGEGGAAEGEDAAAADERACGDSSAPRPLRASSAHCREAAAMSAAHAAEASRCAITISIA